MSDIASRVKAIIVDKLGVDENEVVTEASFTNDLGADSLEHFLTTTETLRSQIAQTLGERCAASIPAR